MQESITVNSSSISKPKLGAIARGLMTYVCELVTGQRVSLDNQGNQTMVTVSTSSPGQQQQSSSGFQTGTWTSPPEVSPTVAGAVIKITTSTGHHFIQIQGNSVSMTGGTSAGSSFQQMQVASSTTSSAMPTMQPMQPMEPLKMGDMQMNMNPMEMRMGNMEMRMGNQSSTRAAAETSATSSRKFCRQCGTAVKVGDRFCSNCGHQLD